MKKLSLLLLLFLITVKCPAAILEYNVVSSGSILGDGLSGSVVGMHSIFFYDTQTTNFAQVTTYTNKYYAVDYSTNYPGSYQIVHLTGPRAKPYMMLMSTYTGTDKNGKLYVNSDFIKGAPTYLKTSTNSQYYFPPIMTASGSKGVGAGPNGGLVYANANSTYTFNQTRTIADNNIHRTLYESVDAYIATLESRGFHRITF